MTAFLIRCGAGLLCIAGSALVLAADPAAPSAPAAAFADDAMAFMRFDVEQPDLAGLRSAIERHITDPRERDTDILFVRKYEIAQSKLRDCGVISVVDAIGPDRDEVYLLPGDRAEAATVKTAVLECVRGVCPRISAWGLEFADAAGWLMAKSRTQAPPAALASGDRQKNMQTALAALGKYPGIVMFPSTMQWQYVGERLQAAKGGPPAEMVRFLKLARQIKWVALKARLDAKPMLRLTVEMPDEKSAAELAQTVVPMARAMTTKIEDDEAGSPFAGWWVSLNIVQQLAPTVKGNRVTASASGKNALVLLDWLFVADDRESQKILDADLLAYYRLREWLFEIYPFQHGKWAATLDDLKPLLSDDPQQQQQTYRRLQSHSSGEFPRFAYQPPGQPYNRLKAPPFDSEGTGPRGVAVLVEQKDGQPRHNGLIIYENGDRARNE